MKHVELTHLNNPRCEIAGRAAGRGGLTLPLLLQGGRREDID